MNTGITMSRVLTILGAIVLNVVLVCLAIFAYLNFIEPLKMELLSYPPLEIYISIPFWILGVVAMYENRRFRLFGVGVTVVVVVSLFYCVYWLNAKYTDEGVYYSYELNYADTQSEQCTLVIDRGKSNRRCLYQPEKCLSVDSAQLLIKKGLFGMEMFTDQVRIVENTSCMGYTDINTFEPEGECELAELLAFKRCFTSAIEQYANCILKDSLNPDYFTGRGLLYMYKGDYKKAIADFVTSNGIIYNRVKETIPMSGLHGDMETFIDQISKKLRRNEYDTIAEDAIKVFAMSAFQKNLNGIILCARNLNSEP